MIVIVEDDISIQELLSYALKANNYEVEIFKDGTNLINFLENNSVDILILDVMLPNKNGLEILKEIRENKKLDDIYVIMLTARNEEYNKVVAFDSGADDYMTKPFSVLELISKIKATLRRINRNKNIAVETKIVHNNLCIDVTERIVTENEIVVDLTLKEYELLLLLLKNKGKVLTRDLIFEQIWGYDFQGNSRTLDVHVSSLRLKLKTIAKNIETVRGIGLKFRKDI